MKTVCAILEESIKDDVTLKISKIAKKYGYEIYTCSNSGIVQQVKLQSKKFGYTTSVSYLSTLFDWQVYIPKDTTTRNGLTGISTDLDTFNEIVKFNRKKLEAAEEIIKMVDELKKIDFTKIPKDK